MQRSEWDGSALPERWQHATSFAKSEVIKYYQARCEDAPLFWWELCATQRRQVVLHLCAVGSISNTNYRVRICGGHQVREAVQKALVSQYRNVYPEVHKTWTSPADMLYPKPNGGKRILPSIYTKLRDLWLRANGVYQCPSTMNQGHLRNTCALLKESHVNLIDRLTTILGRMHAHFGNRPDIQHDIEALFHKFETVDVEELYPIFEQLVRHIEPEISIGINKPWLDDTDWLREF